MIERIWYKEGILVDTEATFGRFLAERDRLIEKLEASRKEMDAWIAEHRAGTCPLIELAAFEGLVSTRKTMLQELLYLDNALMEHLVQLNAKSSARNATD